MRTHTQPGPTIRHPLGLQPLDPASRQGNPTSTQNGGTASTKEGDTTV